MYSINDLAVMSGLTTRSLRNYLSLGLLRGEKINGIWRFTEEQITDFFNEPSVRTVLRSKKRAQVFDFLADERKPGNAACVVLDLNASLAEANEISSFFCEMINEVNPDELKFAYTFEKGHARITLTGTEENVRTIMAAYYSR